MEKTVDPPGSGLSGMEQSSGLAQDCHRYMGRADACRKSSSTPRDINCTSDSHLRQLSVRAHYPSRILCSIALLFDDPQVAR